MAATYPFEIITPNETVYRGEIESLIAPGALGYLGALAHHAPLMTSLTKGRITVREGGGATHLFQLDSGILEIHKDGAVILTESVKKVE